MVREEKNLKDSIKDTSSVPAPYQTISLGSMSYTKTNKLITALYMVTDIIDKDEPLRNKLRTLGTGIISDINSDPADAVAKISEVMSFLDIAFAVNIISEMNCSILQKEFFALNQSIKDSTDKVKIINRQINLAEFFKEPTLSSNWTGSNRGVETKGQPIGHSFPTRIGVQKGSTLMKALNGVVSNKFGRPSSTTTQNDFDNLKKQRRNDIISILKITGGNATIKDIKDKAQASQGKFVSFTSSSEKTLQRELVSMVKDNVLNKVGEKRWSRYFLK